MPQRILSGEEIDDLNAMFEEACSDAEAEDCPQSRNWIAERLFAAVASGEREFETLRQRTWPGREDERSSSDEDT